MPWAQLIDAVFWLIALIACFFLAGVVLRRRDLAARLFLAIACALAVAEFINLLVGLAGTWVTLAPRPGSESVDTLLVGAWPVTSIAFIAFSCLAWHFYHVFPIKSPLLEKRPWTPLLVYMPGIALSAIVSSALVLGTRGYREYWGLNRLGLSEHALQSVFITLVLGEAALWLVRAYRSQPGPLVRQRLVLLLWSLALGGGLVIATNYIPDSFGLSVPAARLPGLQQLPILVMLVGYALSLVPDYGLDLRSVIRRSLVYSVLAAAVTVLYLAIGAALSAIASLFPPGHTGVLSAVITPLIVVLVALPLRDAIQGAIDRVLLRGRQDYQQLLNEYSGTLTALATTPRLLATLADQLDSALHPAGLAIVLADATTAFQVMLSRGRLAAGSPWRQGATFERHHFTSTFLSTRRQPFYLPVHLDAAPAMNRAQWLALEHSGAELFIPMHLRGNLAGWLVLGPRLADVLYRREDLEFLSALANQSAVALDNARLFTTMQQRATELAMVSTVSSAISSSLDLEYVLQTIVETIIQVVGCDKSAIFEIDEEGHELNLRMAKGLSRAYIDHAAHLKIGQDPRAIAVATRQPLVVPDMEHEPLLVGLLPLARGEGIRSLIDVPLVGRQGAVGVLSVYFKDVHTSLSGELDILTTFASQAAVAIENARLYASAGRARDRARRLYEQTDAALARRVEELTAIEAISRQLTSTFDLRRVMVRVLERTLQVASADRGLIAFYEPEQHCLFNLVQLGFPLDTNRYRLEPWPDTRGVCGRVARTGQVALVPDVRQDPDYDPTVETTASLLAVPIVRGPSVLGVINLESDRLAAFALEHVRFVQVVAEHAALAMANGQLFQEVTEARDRLQAILNSTRDAVLVLDTAGRVVLTNPGVRELLGPAVEEWLWLNDPSDEQSLHGLRSVENADLDLERLLQAIGDIRRRPDKVVDVAFSFANGSRRCWVEGTASPVVSAGGQSVGRVAVLRDVTRQHELEQFREELTSMLIHNLQGPLVAMISCLEMLRDDYGLAEEPGELVRIALTSGSRLSMRIESLLKARLLEDRQLPLDLQPIPLARVVQPVLQEYRALAIAGRVTLEAHLPDDLPPIVADEEIISRLFSNLIDNALKFTPPGGRIEVAAHLDTTPDPEGQQRAHPFVVCTVSDTGRGIPPAVVPQLFRQYRFGTKGDQSRRAGSGIGLHYCRLAAEAHGGRIWVESQEGKGSTFYVTLPLGLPPGEANRHAGPPA